METRVLWSPGMTLEALEQMVILKAFAFYRSNKTTTATALGISIRTLDNKLEKYEMNAIDEEASFESRRQEREFQLARSRGFAPAQPVAVTVAGTRMAPKAPQGAHVESIANAPAQPQVPVSKRQKV